MKATCAPQIRTERSRDYTKWPSLFAENAPYADERRKPLLLERAVCVLASPLITIYRIPGDLFALEIYARGEDSQKYGSGFKTHPLLNGNTHDDCECFWVA